MGKTIVVASGKGGTGKTMFTANLGVVLASRGHKVVVIDMDMGLRNLDLYLGLEDKVVYDANDVLTGVCRIKQALIKDREVPGLSLMAASPKPLDGEVTPIHMKVLCEKLKEAYDFVIVDAPAGLDDGTYVALGGAERAILVITPEYSSIRDAESMAYALGAQGIRDVYYVINKVNPDLINAGLAPSADEIPKLIRERVVGVLKDDVNILISTNLGTPIVSMGDSYIKKNFVDIAERIENM